MKKEHRYLTHAEVGRLTDNSGKHQFLVLVFTYTGLRWGEAIGLLVRDIGLPDDVEPGAVSTWWAGGEGRELKVLQFSSGTLSYRFGG